MSSTFRLSILVVYASIACVLLLLAFYQIQLHVGHFDKAHVDRINKSISDKEKTFPAYFQNGGTLRRYGFVVFWSVYLVGAIFDQWTNIHIYLLMGIVMIGSSFCSLAGMIIQRYYVNYSTFTKEELDFVRSVKLLRYGIALISVVAPLIIGLIFIH